MKKEKTFTCSIPSTDEAAASLLDDAMEFLSSQRGSGHADPEALSYVRLALEESVVNALVHGNRRDPGKRVTVTIEAKSEKTVITVRDEGKGFDPGEMPDIRRWGDTIPAHGMGLCLLRHLFNARWTDHGRCVCMETA